MSDNDNNSNDDTLESWGTPEQAQPKTTQVLSMPVTAASAPAKAPKPAKFKFPEEWGNDDKVQVILHNRDGAKVGEANMDVYGKVFDFTPPNLNAQDGKSLRAVRRALCGEAGDTYSQWCYLDDDDKPQPVRMLFADEAKRKRGSKTGQRRGRSKIERLRIRVEKAERKLADLRAQLADAEEDASNEAAALAATPPVEQVAVQPEEPASKEPDGEHLLEATAQVQGMKKSELKTMAKQLGLKGYSKLKSDELQDRVIDALALSLAG